LKRFIVFFVGFLKASRKHPPVSGGRLQVVFASRCRPRRGSRCRRSVMTRTIVLQCVVQHRCGRVQAKFTSTRRWALVLRPEHHPRSDQSGHVEQPACRTRCPKEPHAQRSSWHLQRHRQPAQSEDLPPEVWLPTLSDNEPSSTPRVRACSTTCPLFSV